MAEMAQIQFHLITIASFSRHLALLQSDLINRYIRSAFCLYLNLKKRISADPISSPWLRSPPLRPQYGISLVLAADCKSDEFVIMSQDAGWKDIWWGDGICVYSSLRHQSITRSDPGRSLAGLFVSAVAANTQYWASLTEGALAT